MEVHILKHTFRIVANIFFEGWLRIERTNPLYNYMNGEMSRSSNINLIQFHLGSFKREKEPSRMSIASERYSLLLIRMKIVKKMSC